MKKIEDYITNLLKERNWKAPATAGALALIVAALLKSGLVMLILALLQLLFTLGGLALLAYAVYLAYPVIVKKFKESRKTN